MTSSRIPIACTLTPTAAEAQLGEWSALLAQLEADESIRGGRRLSFPISLASVVDDLARREAACCSFLTITTRRTEEQIVLELRSDDPAALPVVEAIAGRRP